MEVVEKRILSIAGGGLKGACPAAFLASVEEKIGRPIVDYFDLIVGTSTGGVIALGLGLGMSAQEILNMYGDIGPKVFGRHSAFDTALGLFKRLTAAEYDPKPLEEVLRAKFGEKTLEDSNTRLVITALNVKTGEPVCFRTPHHPDFVGDAKIKAVDVALATTAAPTYFPVHKLADLTLADGGLWAVDPVEQAVIEAIGEPLNWPHHATRVLSLGCTDEEWDPGKLEDVSHQGTVDWMPKVFGIRSLSGSKSALRNARRLLGSENVFRIDPVVPKHYFEVNRPEDLPQLCLSGRAAADEQLPYLQAIFFGHPAEPYEPIRTYQNPPENINPVAP